ncbi:hypothetical protein PLEOSDRAFT_1076550 [Pleurotus ostreatus PC15]|uniref:Protein SQS1 n=1 Tax=Pleurotus ostreatus (strain PC15) TaxID=1137138 RepID=A0A067NH64_PLEO1|nr:hypothetical protein PLEOSDRAFT_1076550 [Pleurotus ostreatus PC15]
MARGDNRGGKGSGRGGRGGAGRARGQNFGKKRGGGNFRGRGRGRGGGLGSVTRNPNAGAAIATSGASTPRGRGRGRGRGGMLRADAPLSKLLFQERPLLRPIKFVKSVNTPTLFQDEEEVFKPGVESAGDEEASHVPTADQVARVFSGSFPRLEDGELEEIDFQDLHKLALVPESQVTETQTVMEETFTGVLSTTEAFFVDTTPSVNKDTSIKYDTVALETAPLGENDDDDEQIVYVAPHPRVSTRALSPSIQHPIPPITTEPFNTVAAAPLPEVIDVPTTQLSTASFDFNFAPSPRKQPRHPPVFTASARSKAVVKQRTRLGRAMKRKQKSGGFTAFGAMMSEAQLRGEEIKDPRWEERRRGDSDIDWGDEDENGAVDEVSSGIGGMDLDPDLELDANALKSFVKSMGAGASNHVTMDDVADAEMIREEDEAEERSEDGGSSQDGSSEDEDKEVDAAVNAEEELIISEALDLDVENEAASGDEDDEDLSDEEEDEDGSDLDPGGSFQARLTRIRANSKGKQRARDADVDSDDNTDEDLGQTRAQEDDDFIARIEEMLDENVDILNAHDRKQRKSFFKAIHDGDFDDVVGYNTPKRAKDKGKDLPPELAALWEKDRQRKAENKRLRRQAQLEFAADPFSNKKGGKKGQKAVLAAARLDPTSVSMPNRIIDMQTLENKIRQFIANIGGPRTMSLPPMRKDLRKMVHEMALAFNLKSKSEGKGDARYTTLTKTTRTGVAINEFKVSKIVRRSGGRGFTAPPRNGNTNQMKMKDGDEVGKAAPKIGESNIGFQMLAAMGWSQGERIGLSGGLEDPLTAIMKRTRLGLGATV